MVKMKINKTNAKKIGHRHLNVVQDSPVGNWQPSKKAAGQLKSRVKKTGSKG